MKKSFYLNIRITSFWANVFYCGEGFKAQPYNKGFWQICTNSFKVLCLGKMKNFYPAIYFNFFIILAL